MRIDYMNNWIKQGLENVVLRTRRIDGGWSKWKLGDGGE